MPTFQELTAFEAAARHGNFTEAARELSLTQGAVSKQIRQLENRLGVFLFERVKSRVVLTISGSMFLFSTRRVLHEYKTATHSIIASSGSDRALKIATLPAFASRWLIPRLPQFLALYPKLSVNMISKTRPFDLSTSSFDAAIHFGSPIWAEAEATYLREESLIAVVSPSYANLHKISLPSDLKRVVLIQQTTRPNLWQDWFNAMGCEHPYPLRGPLFDQFAMVIAAATEGLGVALLPSFLIERELAAGDLLPIGGDPLRGTGSYYIVVPLGRRRDPTVSAFVEWVADQTRRDLDRIHPA
jgi:LysR family glycine cleavage system transcriptional activator